MRRRTAPDGPSFLVLNKQRKHAVNARRVSSFLSKLAVHLGKPVEPFAVVFVTDRVMRKYNRTFRGLDTSTDVLSFPGDDNYLGDILISIETAYNQALKSPTLTFETNIRRLLLHGLLHLIGYDHETDDGEMRTIERRLRRKFQC